MRLLFLTNNPEVSNELYEWLVEQKEDVVYYSDKIDRCFLIDNKIEFVISYNYKYLITKEVIEYLPYKVINLHISLLPYNKGSDPNIWSFIDKTPAGVTIHQVDEGLDTGDILVQKEISFDIETETLSSSYLILQQEIKKLFRQNWKAIKLQKIMPKIQSGGGSFHRKRDLLEIKKAISFDKKISEILTKMDEI